MRLPETEESAIESDAAPTAGPSSIGLDGPKVMNGHMNGNGSVYHSMKGSSIPSPNGKPRRKPTVEEVVLPGTSFYTDDPSVNREHVVRLMIQSLRDVGYHAAATTLEVESGYMMEVPEVAVFRRYILEADWVLAGNALAGLGVSLADLSEARFLIGEQKFMELLEAGKTTAALYVLRHELAPLHVETALLHSLSSLLMCTDVDELRQRSGWEGSNGSSRLRLLDGLRRYIPPSTMLPPRRLVTLLQQARNFQSESCLYANAPYFSTSSSNFSLFSDRTCHKSLFPKLTTAILEAHRDEIWNIAFSHDGEFLASASKDQTIIIWHIGKEPSSRRRDITIAHVLAEHIHAVGCIAWSLDDSLLLSSAEYNIRLWDPRNGRCLRSLDSHEDQVVSLVWLPDGTGFLSAGLDRKILQWNLLGELVDSWGLTALRVTDLAITPDSKRLIVLGMPFARNDAGRIEQIDAALGPPSTVLGTTQQIDHPVCRVIIYDFATKKQETTLGAIGQLTSVKVSKDSRFALLNHCPDGLYLWDIRNARLACKFFGQKHAENVIRGCFGGTTEKFVVSGSSDGLVHVWNRETGVFLENLTGHGSGSVNAVVWNPTQERMFASCSDDHTIRIWETDPSSDAHLSCDACAS